MRPEVRAAYLLVVSESTAKDCLKDLLEEEFMKDLLADLPHTRNLMMREAGLVRGFQEHGQSGVVLLGRGRPAFASDLGSRARCIPRVFVLDALVILFGKRTCAVDFLVIISLGPLGNIL